MHLLITAGPTREYLDPVRFLSNGSSGRMGYACAEVAVARGHRVTLVSGPVDLTVPQGVRVIRVVSGGEMAQAVDKVFDRCDGVIMAAAVGDYRPKRRQPYKMRKSGKKLLLELEPTSDILAGLGRRKTKQVLIGFAVQDRAGRENARRKLRQKKLDAIVLNSPAAFGAERSEVQILVSGGRWQSFGRRGKKVLAGKIIRLAEGLARKRQR